MENKFNKFGETSMPSKRRNNGRSKNNRGAPGRVNCDNCNRIVPKDKAIKKFQVRDIIDAASKDDIGKASAYKGPTAVPKLMLKMYYCVSCAIHNRIVAVRSVTDRRKRDTGKRKFQRRPQEQKKTDDKKETDEVKA